MDKIISEIMEYCQNDMDYLQDIINELQSIVDNATEEKYEEPTPWDLEFEKGFKGSNEY